MARLSAPETESKLAETEYAQPAIFAIEVALARLFGESAIAVDVWISPEQLVTEYVARLIRYPGALQVLDFADGRVRLVGVRALQGGPLVGQALSSV